MEDFAAELFLWLKTNLYKDSTRILKNSPINFNAQIAELGVLSPGSGNTAVPSKRFASKQRCF